MDDFSAHPPTIGELRADREQGAAAWTPRDVLISYLRDLDAGKVAPDMLVIMGARIGEGGTAHPSFRVASPSPLHTLGLIELVRPRLTA